MPANISRLSQMQASFQQKQLQDKEQKLLSMFESHQDKFLQKLEDQTQSRTSSAENQNVQMSSGKVRQLFEERRKLTTKTTTKTSQNGWDKSHPLKPIKSNKTANNDPLNKLLASHNKDPVKNDLSSPTNNENTSHYNTGNSIFGKLPNIGGELLSTQKPKETTTKLFTKNTGTVKPSVTTTSSINKSMANVRITPAKKPEPVKTPTKTPPTPLAPPRKRPEPKPAPPPPRTPAKIAPTAGAALTAKSPKSPIRMAPPTDPNMAQCKQCGRNFAKDRIEAHERICSKTAKKKRKVFDPVKHRLKGTEAESYLTKVKRAPPAPVKSGKSNWRKKHEEFIANIRAAKQAQDFIKNGGDVRDLPPPPPMDTSDLVPCPHCGRKFSEGAAERHIPKCATMRHNKPTPTKKPLMTRR
uniref:Zinc finger C2HC domain-containing protein 1C n=1 Tax=Cacopsylla melanoneura TaxID=428564 RepID=A0A8D8QK99_9HEMI